MTATRVLLALFAVFVASSSSLAADAIFLSPGQSYASGENTIICTDGRSMKPIALQECQYWDDFNKKCLYEATRYVLPGAECIEKCQHWDSFFKRCYYAVSCRFERNQGVFVETSCAEFDDFSKKCLRQTEKIIHGGETGKHDDGAR